MTNLSRRHFLGASAAALMPSILRGKPNPKRNLLFLASDDLNTCLSCYGHPLVKTPNIDRLAKSGVRFNHAYTQFPLCNPSRSSIMTGLAPDTTTVFENQRHFRQAIPDAVTIGNLFQKNGYFTARVGKIYHYGVPAQIGTPGLDDPQTWNLALNPKGVDHAKEEPLLTNYTPTRGLGSAIAFHASQAKDEEHTDGMTATEIVRLLEQHREEPFFLAAGFYRPHTPYIAPSKYFDQYPLDKIQALPFDESEMRIAPEPAYFTTPANWGMDEKKRRDALRAYYASISFMDAQAGRILDGLERLKLTHNTTVVFWSDHGYQLGEHGQWMKQTVFEAAARVPFIIGGAGVGARGKTSQRTTELLDLYPTVADLCNLQDRPPNLHGRSLVPLINNPNAPWDKPAITQVRRKTAEYDVMGYSLRTERYRYTKWADGSAGEELYDYELDPRELKNRAADASSANLKRDLRSQLDRILEQRKGRS